MNGRNIELVERIASRDHRAVVVTLRADGSPHCALVHAGILHHPVEGTPVAAFVSWPGTAKLRHVRRHPRATLVFRDGWEWVAVEGGVELVGPGTGEGTANVEDTEAVIREILVAAGREAEIPSNQSLLDRHQLTGVLVRPDRIYSGF